MPVMAPASVAERTLPSYSSTFQFGNQKHAKTNINPLHRVSCYHGMHVQVSMECLGEVFLKTSNINSLSKTNR
mgnify:CR=1 FL=1